MIVMERLQEPYMLLAEFFKTCTLHSVHLAIHYTLSMLRTHIHPNVVHGDLHFGNIFVDGTIGNFACSAKPIQFIDFGRTTVLSQRVFTRKDIQQLCSIDVVALVRAACRACIRASTSKRQHCERTHIQATCVIDVVTHFLECSGMTTFNGLRLLATTHMPPAFPKTEKKKGTCDLCATMYDWIEYLLKHKFCTSKQDKDSRYKLSFLDITAGIHH
jgi:hypothetical protein